MNSCVIAPTLHPPVDAPQASVVLSIKARTWVALPFRRTAKRTHGSVEEHHDRGHVRGLVVEVPLPEGYARLQALRGGVAA